MSAPMPRTANPLRGETCLSVAGRPCRLRPTFSALVAAEAELGPLPALVERAAGGGLRLAEMAALFWHCLEEREEAEHEEITRDTLGEAIAAQGLAACAAPLRALLGQILKGTG